MAKQTSKAELVLRSEHKPPLGIGPMTFTSRESPLGRVIGEATYVMGAFNPGLAAT